MRIQETDRILKESRYSRHDNTVHNSAPSGVLSRAWHAVTHLFKKH
jgi:hypothetical protein